MFAAQRRRADCFRSSCRISFACDVRCRHKATYLDEPSKRVCALTLMVFAGSSTHRIRQQVCLSAHWP